MTKKQVSSRKSATALPPFHGFLPDRALVMSRKGGLGRVARSSTALGASTAMAPTALGSLAVGKSASPLLADSRALESSPGMIPDTLEAIAQDLNGCTRCKLCKTRKHIVLGEGDPHAKILFVGEGPGEQEDLTGRPFVGPAGQLLDKMIEAMGLKREQVFITNGVKCRPPQNRDPEPDETETCSPFLMRQIAAIQPQVIVTLGKSAMQALLKSEAAISKVRGQFVSFQGAKLMPTFHPSYLLRNPAAKKEVWEDLQKVAKEIGLTIPKRGSPAGAQA